MRSLLVIALLLDLFLVMPAGIADTPPPASGDWTITDTTVISDQTIELNGNLTVKSGGRLEIDKSAIVLNCSTDGQYSINVENGGEMILNSTNITSRQEDLTYRFSIHGKAFIDNCTIQHLWGDNETRTGGIEIYSDGASIISSTISHNRGNGITVHDSSPSIMWCHFEYNGNGIVCRGNAGPTVYGTQLEYNYNGIINCDNSSANISYGSLFISTNFGILNCDNSSPQIESCWMGINRKVGILNINNTTPIIRLNWIMVGTPNGILNYDRSAPRIIDNIISSYNLDGIGNWNESKPFIHNNTFYSGNIGIESNNMSAPEITENTIYDMKYAGISNGGYTNSTIKDNNITKCYQAGILNFNFSKSVMFNNSIMNMVNSGIINMDFTEATIDYNFISYNKLHGIENDNEVKIKVRNNTINNNLGNGILNNGFVASEIVNNSVTGNGIDGIVGIQNKNITIIGNYISGNHGNGISNGMCSGMIVDNNTITDNLIGIAMDSIDGSISRNNISGGEYGIKLFNCSPEISNNVITCTTCGIQMSSSNSTISDTQFAANQKYAIYCGGSSSPLIVNSTVIRTIQGRDLAITGDSHPTTLNTTFDRSLVQLEDTSSLCVKWYLQLWIVDSRGSPLDFANLSIVGKDTILARTDTYGAVSWIPLEDRTIKKGFETRATYNATVEKDDVSSYDNITVNKSESRVLVFDFSPVIMPIPEQFIDENFHFYLNLSKYIFDRDHDTSDLMVSLCNGSENDRNVSLNGTILSLYYSLPSADENIFFSVGDGIKNRSSKISVHVNSVNDPPAIGMIPIVEVFEHTSTTFDLSPYLSDEEDPVNELTVTVDSPHATSSGNRLKFYYPEGMRKDAVNIIVTDSDGALSVSTINITIIPVNDPPVVTAPFNITPVEDMEYPVDISRLVSDPDSPIEDIRITTNSSYCMVEGLILHFKYPEGVTKESVQINVSDGRNWTLYDVAVIVTPVDDPPKLIFPEITVVAGTSYRQDLWDFLSDPDTPKERLVLSTNSPYATIRGFNITFRYPANMASGYNLVHLSVTDGTSITTVDMPVNVTAQKTTVRLSEQYAIYLYIGIPLTVFGTVAGILAYRRVKYGWYEIKRALLVNYDGRMLAHSGEKSESDDELLVSSMLTAVQQFIEEAMKKEKAGSIKEFQYEDMKIAVERGEKLFLAIFLNGYTTDGLRNKMKDIVNAIEGQFKKDLAAWDGRITSSEFIDEAKAQLNGLMEKKASKQNQQ